MYTILHIMCALLDRPAYSITKTTCASDGNDYRAMHFSAMRGIAIACRLSVCLCVRLSVRL